MVKHEDRMLYMNYIKYKIRRSLILLTSVACLLGTLIVGCNQIHTREPLSEVPKGTLSARLFPYLGKDDQSVLNEEYYEVGRLNTILYNSSSKTVTITKIEFLDPDGIVAFTLPKLPSTAHGYKHISLTLGSSDLPELWENWQLSPGSSLFTGIEFDVGFPARQLEGWRVLWHGLDANGVQFVVIGEYSELP